MAWWRPKTPLAADEVTALSEHLAQIPELYAQLPTIDEPDRPEPGEPNDDGGHVQPGSRAPINLTVVQLTDTKLASRRHDPGRVASIHRLGALPTLVWWSDAMARQMLQRHVEFAPLANPATVASECAWLAKIGTFALAQPWAPLYVRDIAALRASLEEATTGKREPWVPRCSKCSNVLKARDEASWYECPSCGKQYTPGTMVDLGRRQPPMPASEIAKALGISPSTITTWRDRDLIIPARRDHRGRPLYYLADVLRVKERVRDRSEHRRRKDHK